MGKARMMGAGNAGSSLYNSNVNLKTCGGNKKQGLPPLDGVMNFAHRKIKINAIGNRRDVIFSMNQLGGVSSSAFSSSAHSNASGDGFQQIMPFICAPYCIQSKLNTPAVPLDIPNNIEAVLTIPHNNIFTYCFYDGVPHCYTDASLAKNVIDFKKAKINNQSIQEYLVSNYPTTNVDINKLTVPFINTLQVEDMNDGDKTLLKEDRVVEGLLYSTPEMTGFPRGTSICSKLYSAMASSYPEEVNTCPQRQPILNVEDEFVFAATFIYNGNEKSINFNIRIV
jgi:hypothetical protein